MIGERFANDIQFLQRLLNAAGIRNSKGYKIKVDGIRGEETNAAIKRFNEWSNSIAQEFGTFDQQTEDNIRTLLPQTQYLARGGLRAIRNKGINARIISGTRTYAEQDQLYRIGRDLPGEIVTYARGGQGL